MLNAEELLVLESLLARARHEAGSNRSSIHESIQIGDVVQLRPGADSLWETSLLLVCRIHDDGSVSGQILQPHRGGVREAWWRYTLPEVARIGRTPYPEPAPSIKSWSFDPCPVCREWSRKRKQPQREGKRK